MTTRRLIDRLGGLAFGGDHNPEPWDEADPEPPGLPPGVESVTRHASDGRRWQVVLNHRATAVPLPAPAHDLLTGGCAVPRMP